MTNTNMWTQNKEDMLITDKTVVEVINETASIPDSEDPFFVCDLADVVFKHKLWKLKMPRVLPFYAVKCNNSPAILAILASLGTGFDCASKGEIEQILNLGVHPSQIIYANPCKTKSFIKHAAQVGVDLMTFDNEVELHKVKALHPNAKLVIRIRVDDSSAVCQLGIKFGCTLPEAAYLLNVAKNLDLNVVGVSFHVGSGCRDPMAYDSALYSAYQVFQYGQELGFRFDLLDIGGGFPGNKGTRTLFEDTARVVADSLDKYFPESSGVTVIAEPGRFYVASAFTLCTNVIAKRYTTASGDMMDQQSEPRIMYYINDGVYGSFNCLVFDHAEVSPMPHLRHQEQPLMCSTIWGPTCDSFDRVKEECYLPELQVGEWLLFESMGAYTLCAASTFNGFQKPVIKFVLPAPTCIYLRTLPMWPVLLKMFGNHLIGTDFSDLQCRPEDLDHELGFGYQLPEPISA